MKPSNHHPVEFSGVPCKKDGPGWTCGLVTPLYGVTDGRVMELGQSCGFFTALP